MGIITFGNTWLEDKFSKTKVDEYKIDHCERNRIMRALGFLFHRPYAELTGIVELFLIMFTSSVQ